MTHIGYWDINGHTHVYLGEGREAIRAWGEMMGDKDRRTVAAEEIKNIYVSTVFLGLDHGFGDGPPLLFETMAFVHDGGDVKYDQVCWRYATWDEAERGHRDMCQRIRDGTELEDEV